MPDKKIKIDYLYILKKLAKESDFEFKDETLNFLENEINNIITKKDRYIKSQEKKHETWENAKEFIKTILSDNNTWATEKITEVLESDYNTPIKKRTVAKLCMELTRDGILERTYVRREDKSRITAYRLV